MRKFLPPLFLLIFLILTSNAFSQTPNELFSKTYQEYSAKVEEHRKCYDNYVVSKSQFEKFKTLLARDIALEAAKEYLICSADLIRLHINIFKPRTQLQERLTDGERAEIFSQIDSQITWLEDYKARVRGIDVKENIKPADKELERQYLFSTQLLGRKLIAQYKLTNYSIVVEGMGGVIGKINERISMGGGIPTFVTRSMRDISRNYNSDKLSLEEIRKQLPRVTIPKQSEDALNIINSEFQAMEVRLQNNFRFIKEVLRTLGI